MRKSILVLLLAAMVAVTSGVVLAQQADDIQKHPVCTYCNMDRQQYAHSRFLIEYEDGSTFGACSIHCAAVDVALHIDKTPKAYKVGDYGTKKLIDAETAAWVIGGNKPGVMTKRAKWAFEKKEDAEKFAKENGGELATFDKAMEATFNDMFADTKMINQKRKMKKHP